MNRPSVHVDRVRHAVVRGGEVLGAKLLVNQRSLRGKPKDDVLDDCRLVEGLLFYACCYILSLTTLGLHKLKGIWVPGQSDPPSIPCDIVKRNQGD